VERRQKKERGNTEGFGTRAILARSLRKDQWKQKKKYFLIRESGGKRENRRALECGQGLISPVMLANEGKAKRRALLPLRGQHKEIRWAKLKGLSAVRAARAAPHIFPISDERSYSRFILLQQNPLTLRAIE